MQVRILLEAPMIAAIAQLAERLICNQDVRGSIPRGGTNITVDITIESVYIDYIR